MLAHLEVYERAWRLVVTLATPYSASRMSDLPSKAVNDLVNKINPQIIAACQELDIPWDRALRITEVFAAALVSTNETDKSEVEAVPQSAADEPSSATPPQTTSEPSEGDPSGPCAPVISSVEIVDDAPTAPAAKRVRGSKKRNPEPLESIEEVHPLPPASALSGDSDSDVHDIPTWIIWAWVDALLPVILSNAEFFQRHRLAAVSSLRLILFGWGVASADIFVRCKRQCLEAAEEADFGEKPADLPTLDFMNPSVFQGVKAKIDAKLLRMEASPFTPRKRKSPES